MIESIFSIVCFAIFLFLIGIFIYYAYLNFTDKDVFKYYEQLKEYEEYLELHNCKLYEYTLLEYQNKISNNEMSNDEMKQIKNKSIQKELSFCNEFVNYHPKIYIQEKEERYFIIA